MQFLGEADDDHEEQQHGECTSSNSDAHDLELGDDGLTASAFVPHIVLNVTPEQNTQQVNIVIKQSHILWMWKEVFTDVQ